MNELCNITNESRHIFTLHYSKLFNSRDMKKVSSVAPQLLLNLTTCLVWYGVSCFLYRRIIELTRSLAENCSIERFTWPLLKSLLLQNQGSQVGNSVWRKPPLTMDPVQVERKHTPKPGVHRGNNNCLNNNDHKLLSMAEWWQDFLKELAEHWCFKDRMVGVCYDFNRTKGQLFVLLTLSQHKQPR